MQGSSFLDDLLKTSGPKPATGADPDDGELPDPKGPYQAHARPLAKAVYSFHCLKGAEGIVSFQYVNLDSHSQFQAGEHGQVITLRFAGTQIWQVTIAGLNLSQLYDGIHRHVIPWVRKSDRGFSASADKEPLIMGIDVKVIPREE